MIELARLTLSVTIQMSLLAIRYYIAFAIIFLTVFLIQQYILYFCRSVANRLSELDQQKQQAQANEDIEMVPIAEDALLNEKFSLQGTSTGSGRRKVVCSRSFSS